VKRAFSALGNSDYHDASGGDDLLDSAQPVNIDELECSSPSDVSPPFCFAKSGTAQFAELVIAGTVIAATNCLVQQTLLQAPISLYLDDSAKLPPYAIILHSSIFPNIS
jgi:hypothetical protein